MSVDLTNYLDLTFTVGGNSLLYTKLKHKCDDLSLHIVKFSILSLIPSGPFHSMVHYSGQNYSYGLERREAGHMSL